MNLRKKINLILKALEHGIEIKIKSGHTLAMPDYCDEPGFATFNQSNQTDTVMMVGSETAWMSLIAHAKEMSDEELVKLTFSTGAKDGTE